MFSKHKVRTSTTVIERYRCNFNTINTAFDIRNGQEIRRMIIIMYEQYALVQNRARFARNRESIRVHSDVT